jgi:hypothetical protein
LWLVGGFGIADGGGPNFASAFASYVLPQLVWLIVGIVRYNRGVGNKLPKIARQAERLEPLFGTVKLAPVRATSAFNRELEYGLRRSLTLIVIL